MQIELTEQQADLIKELLHYNNEDLVSRYFKIQSNDIIRKINEAYE